MREQLQEIFGFGGRVMNFHPGLNSGCGEDNVLGIHNGIRDPVPGVFQKRLNLNAPADAGVIVAMVRENQDFEIMTFTRLVKGAQFLKLFIERAKHGENIAGQMLGIVRGANVGVVVVALVIGIEKISDQFMRIILIRVGRTDITQGPKETVPHLPVHLFFVLHRGGDAIHRQFRICGFAEISALITGQRAIAKNVRPRDVAGGGKGRDEAADREVSLMEALTVEFKAMGVL